MQLSLKHAESLKEHLSNIPDPRFRRGIRHRKLSVVTTALCALICGAHNFTAIAQWTKSCTQSMLKRLGCRLNQKTRRYEPPSEPTIRRLLQSIDADAVDQAFSGWLCSLTGEGLAIAIDGKTLKGARQKDGSSVHLLSAFLHQKGIVIAQCEVESSTNEIPVARQLLEPLNIQGSVVTLDALHRQKDTDLSPQKASPERLLMLNRGHWSIENSLHYVRDVTFSMKTVLLSVPTMPQELWHLSETLSSVFFDGYNVPLSLKPSEL